jgi:hypothetical protein
MDIRQEIARLSEEHDKLLADDTAWLDRRNVAAALLARNSGPDGLLHRDGPNNAQAGSPAAVEAPSNGDGGGALFGDARDEMLARSLGVIVATLRKESEAEIAKLKAEMREIISTEVVTLHGDCSDLRGRVSDMDEVLSRATTTLRGAVERIRLESRNEKHDRAIRNQAITERSARVAELQQQNAAARADLERRHRESEFDVRDRRIEALEIQLSTLLKFIGGGLPRGFGGE